MNLDSVSLKAVVKEMSPLLLGGVVQKISQLTRLDVVMQIRQIGVTHKLLLRFSQESAGLGLTRSQLPPAEAPTAFVMLLRKHLQGKKIAAIEQKGLERLIKFRIDDKILLLELFNRSNNLYMLSANEKIMGMLVRDNKAQAQQVGKVYVPLAAPERPDASLVSFADLPEIFAPFAGQTVKEVLPKALFGISPHQAAFIIRRAGLEPKAVFRESDIPNLAMSVDQWQMLLNDGGYEPVLTASGKLSPWPLDEPGETKFPSLLQALERDSAVPPVTNDKREALLRSLGKARDKAMIVLESRRQSLKQTQTMDIKRWCGELILEHIGEIAAEQESLSLPMSADDVPEEVRKALAVEAELSAQTASAKSKPRLKHSHLSLTLGEKTVSVRLDPQQSASENAQMYFKEYRRLQRAVQALQEPIEKAAEEVEFLEELIFSAENSSEAQELEDIRRIWQESNPNKYTTQAQLQKQKNRGVQSGPLGPKSYTFQGFKILVGRNPRQNDQLTFKTAAQGDIWLHAQNTPGAHVVIKTAGRKINDQVLETAAVLAARNCKARQSTHVEVSVCDNIKQLRKPKGAPPGKVLLRSFRTVNVRPAHEIDGLTDENRS
ncbi:NFACT family protein [bacterium]|nr:NFACT family protein [bacterium]